METEAQRGQATGGSGRAAPGLGPRSHRAHSYVTRSPPSGRRLRGFPTRPRPLVRTLNPLPPARRLPGSFRPAGAPAWETEAGSVPEPAASSNHTPGPAKLPPPPQTRMEEQGDTGGRGGGPKEAGLRTRTVLPHSRWRPGAARPLRGGTSACAARSPGPGHKMAGAALGRERRRRQNGRPSRTYSRIPSSPLQAVADARNSLGPCSLHY